MVSLTSLPSEIFTNTVVRYLDPSDVVSLFTCLHLPVSKKIYSFFFDDGVEYDDYNLQMFTERTKAHLYTFGGRYTDPENPYFGDTVPEATDCFQHVQLQEGGPVYMRMTKPVKLPVEEISKVGCGHNAITVTSFDGKLSYVNLLESLSLAKMPETYKLDHMKVKVPARDRFPSVPDYLKGGLERYIGKKPVVREIGCHDPYLCVDQEGLLWMGFSPGPLAPLLLVDRTTWALITGRVLKVKDSIFLRTCFVEGKGIVCWTLQDVPEQGNGHPTMSATEADIVPNTSRDILDWAVVGFSVIYLRKDGSVHGFSIDGSPVNMRKFKAFEPYIHVDGTLSSFALANKKGYVVMDLISDGQTELIPRYYFKVPGVVRVAVGQYHFLALTKAGEVYSWGKETYVNGCLGLGKLEDIVSRPNVELTPNALAVGQPTKLKLPGKVYGIYVEDDHSTVLIYDS